MSTVRASYSPYPRPPKRRRTATGVLAGNFDWQPRDVLTSVLRGIDYHDMAGRHRSGQRTSSNAQKYRRKIKRVDEDVVKEQSLQTDKGKQKEVTDRGEVPLIDLLMNTSSRGAAQRLGHINHRTASFWGGNSSRPESARSVTPSPPPPELSPHPSTPGPSNANTSRGSSKRPRTPEPEVEVEPVVDVVQEAPPIKIRKKRAAAPKGWKGWVSIENDEQPPVISDKLIELDKAPVLKDRKLRSGKDFGAISIGEETWVDRP